MLETVGASAPARLAAFYETGELDTAYQHADLPRFRVNAFRQRGDISFAFRVIPNEVPTFDALRLPARRPEPRRGAPRPDPRHRRDRRRQDDDARRDARPHQPDAAAAHRHDRGPDRDPPRDESCIVNQREVGLDTESFNQALRRVLRQDPDVILIGEMRDGETAETALQAAESGHLVLSTMHTVDAAETIGRLVEFFPAIKQAQIRSILAGVLRGVVSQRLLPRRDGGRVAAFEVMVATTGSPT